MANIRVNALTEVTSIADDDVVMVDGKQGVRATTWAALKNLIKQQCGINELNTKTAKDLSLSPVSLYSGNLCNSALNSYTYAAVDNLDKYQEIGVNFRIGDALTMEERFNANTFSQKTYSAYASNTYNGRIAIFVNFEKNLVGIKTISKAGWDYQYLSITNIYGYLRK